MDDAIRAELEEFVTRRRRELGRLSVAFPPRGGPRGASRLPLAAARAAGELRGRHRRRRAARARDRLLPGDGARHHRRRRRRALLAGLGQRRAQHHGHPLELPVGRERGHLRARAEALGGLAGGARLRPPVRPARRPQPRPQPGRRARGRAARERQPAQRRRRRVARPRRACASSAPSSTPRPTLRYPVLGATLQRRGGIARHDAVVFALGRALHARGVHLLQGLPVESIELDDGRAVGVNTARGPIRAGRVALACAGRSSPLAQTAGVELPLQSHPLQALVSGLLEEVLPCVVMSNAVHVYVSQAHKGELVMGAGVDSYNSYAQRGSFHVIEHQMAAALELFPIFAGAGLLRTWAGIVDVCPDASPIIGLTPVDEPLRQLRLGHRRLQGHAGRGLGLRVDDRQRRPARPQRAVLAGALRVRGAHRRARRRRGGPLMLLIRCPWCGERDEVEFRYGGAAHVAYPADPEALDDAAWSRYLFFRPNPQGPFPSAGCTPPAAGAGSTSCATRRRTPSRARTCPASARSTRGEARAGRRAGRSPGAAAADVGRRAAAGAGRRHAGLRAARRRARRRRPQRRAGRGRAASSRPGRRSRTRGSAGRRARGTSRWWRPRACRRWTGWSRAAPTGAGGCSRTRCATATRSAGRTATCSWSAPGRPG